jgi:hypothetical protein
MTIQVAPETFFNKASFAISLLALAGIPAAGFVVLVGSLQLPRLLYGQANPVFATAEIGSLAALAALVFLLRACLSGPSAPSGVYRDVLDFMAMRHWHSTVWVALVGLLVLPGAWFLHADRDLIFLWRIMGWRALQQSGDFRDDLDRVVVFYQWALTAGVPLLFLLHMLSRWRPRWRILLWLLVPVFFVSTAIGVVVVGTLMHLG